MGDIIDYFDKAYKALAEKKGERATAGKRRHMSLFINFLKQVSGKKYKLEKVNSCNCGVCENARNESKILKGKICFLYHVVVPNADTSETLLETPVILANTGCRALRLNSRFSSPLIPAAIASVHLINSN